MFQIADSTELNALLKTLYVAKFETDFDEELEIAGSPIVAGIFHRAYDALIVAYRGEGKDGPATALERERVASYRVRELSLIRRRVRFVKATWNSWTREDKADYLRSLLSPYQASMPFLQQLIDECDSLDESE